MRAAWFPIALAGLAIAACQAAPPGPVRPGPRTATRPPAATPKPTARPTGAPTPAPTATPAVKPAGKLLAPAGARAVSGLVALEAGYALQHGGIVSDNGGGILQLPGAAGLVSDAGGNIISDNGGGLIGNHAAGWRLAQGAFAPPGLMWGAAGLALKAVDLVSGEPVPLGEDAAGTPAYEVVTDARGGFQVFLPPAGADRVRLEARPLEGEDPRLATAALLLDGATRRDLDEDTAQIAGYIHEVFYGGTIANYARTDADIESNGVLALVDPDEAPTMVAGWKSLVAAMRRARMTERPLAEQRRVASRIADLGIARVPLGSVKLSEALGGAPALDAMAATFKAIRESVARTMKRELDAGRDPAAYFAGRDYLVRANETADPKFAILKPSDFNAFLVRQYFANPALDPLEYLQMASVFASGDVDIARDEGLRIGAASQAFFVAYMRALYLGADPGVKEIIAYLDALPPP